MCPCRERRIAAAVDHRGRLEAAAAQAAIDAQVGADGLARVSHLRLSSFDPGRLAGEDGRHPYTAGADWIAQLADLPAAPSYYSGPPAALFFYSPGKGCGKTHLAAGLAQELARAHSRIAFLDELSFFDRCNAASLEDRERAIALAGDRAYLTVIDDFGAKARPSPGLRDLWYAVINRRWLGRRWLLITSNLTLEELVDQGTIDDRTFSRLHQMTRGELIVFDGPDQRLATPPRGGVS